MSLAAFTEEPWGTSHPTYDQRTFFHIRPAPEFATAEVLVSSMYRSCGLGVHESDVPSAGKEFSKDSYAPRVHDRTGSKVDMDTWRVVINAVLESPKQPNQSAKRFLQMCPIVPDVALYSGSARLSGNSWNPGQLVQRMIAFGAEADAQAGSWRRLFEALSVTEEDDIWARWLQEEFDLRRRAGGWSHVPWPGGDSLPDADKQRLAYPARQFVRDLDGVLQAKPHMTRRQWVSLVEALTRLASVSHVLWLCEVNHRIWQALRAAISDNGQPVPAAERLVSCDANFLSYGNPAVPIIRDSASRYLVARIGINAVLWQLESAGSPVSSLCSLADLDAFLAKVRAMAPQLRDAGVERLVMALREGEKNARTISCKKGIGSNLVEFARHVLGQRQTANETLRGYDQGYILRKKAEYSGAPWIVSMGPVAILALVHCCLRDAAGPRSIQKLCQHLGQYGIGIDRDDVTTSDLGRKLRTLGLVLDSPDAESGMLLIPPFNGLRRPRNP